MHIAEIDVFGNDPYAGLVNLTDTYKDLMTVSQSSTYGGYNASYVIDGNAATFNHTLNGTDEWVELDFNASLEVKAIDIVNRDGLGSRLNGAVVTLLDANDNVIYTSDPITSA